MSNNLYQKYTMSTIYRGFHSTKRISNISVSFDDLGDGLPVVFLHGFPFNKSMWIDQHKLAKQNFRVIAPDLRGFGNSKDDSELSMDLFADDIIALMDQLHLDQECI